MVSKINELNKLKPKVVSVLKKYGIKKAGIFGSFVRGEHKKKSDVDILVEITDKNMSLLGFARIKVDLEDVLKKKVDLVEYKLIRPELKKIILKEEVRII
ncbi:nucleotidyltransferase family protein [Candidatus Pacearchaeota archaeon]|nr:nucleotidyltransferase family protein [Candidatus Pacearchaeota archaeon]